MNTLGEARRPFVFVIPYDLDGEERILIRPIGSKHPEAPPHETSEHGVNPAVMTDSRRAACPQVPLYYQMPGAEQLPHNVPALPENVLWQPEPPSFAEYQRAFETVQHHLHRGNSYLINLCFATPVSCNLSLEQMFSLARAPYKLLVPGWFACFSPEPFVYLEADRIRTFPMKGTVRNADEVPHLLADTKEQREHATVVDLLRNDLAIVGCGVEVERYRYVEQIQTQRGKLFATSSAISASLPAHWPSRLGDMMLSLLPAGSVTGAPKAWTCRAIAEAEPVARGYYTGVFGYFDGLRLRSAVSIRFIEQQREGHFLYRSGGGITTLSRAEDEYRELCDKVYLPFPLTKPPVTGIPQGAPSDTVQLTANPARLASTGPSSLKPAPSKGDSTPSNPNDNVI